MPNPVNQEPIRVEYALWKFLSPSTGEVAYAWRIARPNDIEHEYQSIIRREVRYA